MDQRLSFVTLVVRDLTATRAFYVDGLGWTPEFEDGVEVIMFRVADKVILSLWSEQAALGEIGPVQRGAAPPPVTLAHNCATPDAVDAVLADAARAGAPAVAAATRRAWGGYSGYFCDPDDFRWEVAYNPGPLGESVLGG